jgi:hypothetical protein
MATPSPLGGANSSAVNTPSPQQQQQQQPGLMAKMKDMALEVLSPGSTPGSRAASAAFLASHQNLEDYDITEIWAKRVYGAWCLVARAWDWGSGLYV